MKKELENYLYNKYPGLFIEHSLPPSKTCMCWGCACGAGWGLLLDRLCDSITKYIKRQHEEVDYWKDKEEKPDWIKDKIEPVIFKQIKEKFGTLRIYYSGGDEKIAAMINFAEELSLYICETCGKFDTSIGQTGGWISSLCENCAKSEDRKWEKLEVNKEIEKILKP